MIPSKRPLETEPAASLPRLDVESFKKEALWRELQLSKSLCDDLNRDKLVLDRNISLLQSFVAAMVNTLVTVHIMMYRDLMKRQKIF